MGSTLSMAITVVGIVAVSVYLFHPRTKSPEVLRALGEASTANIKALTSGFQEA